MRSYTRSRHWSINDKVNKIHLPSILLELTVTHFLIMMTSARISLLLILWKWASFLIKSHTDMLITLLALGLQSCSLEYSKSCYSYWRPLDRPSGSERSTSMQSSISRWHGSTCIPLENLTLDSQSRLWSGPLSMNNVVSHSTEHFKTYRIIVC